LVRVKDNKTHAKQKADKQTAAEKAAPKKAAAKKAVAKRAVAKKAVATKAAAKKAVKNADAAVHIAVVTKRAVADLPAAMSVRVDGKGRVGLPKAIRARAGVGADEELVAFVMAPGRILLETRAAIAHAVWEAAPRQEVDQDAVASIRELRREDIAISDANLSRRAKQQASTDAESAQRGEALVRAIGL